MVGNLERLGRRKRQTLLTFDPVDQSSSPSNSTMSPANVRYQRPGQTPLSSKQPPLSTKQAETMDDDDSDDILSSSRRYSSRNKKIFGALPTPRKSSQIQSRSSPDNPKATSEPSTECRMGRKMSPLHSSDGSAPEEEELITPSKRKRNTPSKGKAKHLSDEDSDNQVEEITSSARVTRSSAITPTKNRRQKPITMSDESESELDLPTLQSHRKSASRKDIIELSDDDSDEPVVPSSRPRNSKVVIPQPESDDDEISPPKRRRLVQSGTDSDFVSTPLRRRSSVVQQDDESDSDLPTVSRLGSSRKSKPNKSLVTPNRISRRQGARKHRTAKAKGMELLRRKRAGEKITELTDSELDSEDEKSGGIYDSDHNSELKVLIDFEDEEVSPEAVKKAKSKPKPRRRGANKDDDYDSDFVVEDDDAPLGVPMGFNDIPLEFTHAAHKPLREHFKDAVEWLIHNKINPAFERNDPIYRQAFNKLSYEYDALAHSKFSSNQWTRDFTRALNARPEFSQRLLGEGEGLTVDGEYKCDACNHRKHIPKYAITFGGNAYNKQTLVEVDQNSEEEDEPGEDHHSIDEKGQDLPPKSKEWFTGKFCHENASQAHILIHWRYELNSWVLGNLEAFGHLTPEKLAERERMTQKQRQKAANQVVDDWEANDLIAKLYRDYKQQLMTARDSKKGSGKGGNYA